MTRIILIDGKPVNNIKSIAGINDVSDAVCDGALIRHTPYNHQIEIEYLDGSKEVIQTRTMTIESDKDGVCIWRYEAVELTKHRREL